VPDYFLSPLMTGSTKKKKRGKGAQWGQLGFVLGSTTTEKEKGGGKGVNRVLARRKKKEKKQARGTNVQPPA